MDLQQNVRNLIEKFGVGLSKPQFKNFDNYINGIIKSKGRKTIVTINEESGSDKDQSQLNRFLNESKWNVANMQEPYEDYMLQRAIDGSKEYLFLIFDDTLKKSSVKNRVDGIAKYFDYVDKRFVWGHKIFTSCIANDNEFVAPFRNQIFLNKQYCREEKIRYKKITNMPLDLIDQFEMIDSKGRKKVALFDIGYANRKTLKRLINAKIDFVTKVKNNKKFIYKGKMKRAKDLNHILRISNEVKIKDATYEYSELIEVEWLGVGKLYLMKSKLKGAEDVQYLITNMCLEGAKILELYSYRWLIESMHKDLKQNFGFGDYMVRDLDAIKKHILLSWIACGIVSVIRFDSVSEHIDKLTDRLFAKIKKFFTLGRICKLIRTGKHAQTVISAISVKFMVLKNAKL